MAKLLEFLLVLDVHTLDKSRENLANTLRAVLLNLTQLGNSVTQDINQSESLIGLDVHKTQSKLVKPNGFQANFVIWLSFNNPTRFVNYVKLH